MVNKNESNKKTKDDADPCFYKFHVGSLPDELYHPDVPVHKWLDTCVTTNNRQGFPKNFLKGPIVQLPIEVELERLVGIALYMAGNVFPFTILPMVVAFFFGGYYGRLITKLWLGYYFGMVAVWYLLFRPVFLKRHRQEEIAGKDMRRNQYMFTERNITKYLSMNYVWPQSLHRPNMEEQNLIYCIVPHGVGPIGITAYPLWSKLFNDHLCRWTAAPIIFSIPVIRYFISKVGYIPAKTSSILDALTKRNENVGVILDGIAGMFHQSAHEERAYVKKRKGIVKIALKAGVPIVPCYGFGHTQLWTVVVDPIGICEYLSNLMGASLTPFFGRFGWFLGPPHRIPVTVCLGEPVPCPQISNPTQADIDHYHQKMLDGFQTVFDTHKHSYGWSDKTLKFV